MTQVKSDLYKDFYSEATFKPSSEMPGGSKLARFGVLYLSMLGKKDANGAYIEAPAMTDEIKKNPLPHLANVAELVPMHVPIQVNGWRLWAESGDRVGVNVGLSRTAFMKLLSAFEDPEGSVVASTGTVRKFWGIRLYVRNASQYHEVSNYDWYFVQTKELVVSHASKPDVVADKQEVIVHFNSGFAIVPCKACKVFAQLAGMFVPDMYQYDFPSSFSCLEHDTGLVAE